MKKLLLISAGKVLPLLFLLTFFLTSSHLNVRAADITWARPVASGPGNWGDASNWSPASVPTSSDNVIFNTTGGANCVIDVDGSIIALSINANYPGQISFSSGINLRLSGNLTIGDAGDFVGTDGTIELTGNAVINCVATLENLIINTTTANDDISLTQSLNVENLTITQVDMINDNRLNVSGSIVVNDNNLKGTCVINATGSPTTLSGSGLIHYLQIDGTLNITEAGGFPLSYDGNPGFSLTGSGSTTGENLIFQDDGSVDFTGTLAKLEINTAANNDIITINTQDLKVTNLKITKIGSLNSNNIEVSGTLEANDADFEGTSSIEIPASETVQLSGTGVIHQLILNGVMNITETGGFPLFFNGNGNFSLTGSGSTTGENLIFQDDGAVDFTGTLTKLEINTAAANDIITINTQNLKVADLKITQVGDLNTNNIEVSNSMEVNDVNLTGSSSLEIVAGETVQLSGTGVIHLLIVDGTLNITRVGGFPLFNSTGIFSLSSGSPSMGRITGENLIFNDDGTVNYFGTIEKLELNTVNSNSDVNLSADLTVTSQLSITQIRNLIGGNDLFVQGNIIATDAALGGTCTLHMTGSGASSFTGTGGGAYPAFVVDKPTTADIASLQSSADVFSKVTITSGSIDLNSQTLVSNADITIESAGQVVGEGTMQPNTGQVLNGGIIAPGNSIGTIAITGDLVSSGDLDFEINGTGSGNFDLITVTGSATISAGGTVSGIFGYTPTIGDNYQVITAASFSPTVSLSVNSSPTGVLATYLNGLISVTGILPIDLLYFRAEAIDQTVTLEWATLNEENNDYMAIERSADGLAFDEIGRVAGKGTTVETQTYFFSDEYPLSGTSYYRLRQVDFDGLTEYHPIVSVHFDAIRQLELKVFPNPVTDELRIKWSVSGEKNIQLRLLDMQGRPVASFVVDANSGVYNLPVHHLAAGQYILQALDGGAAKTLYFIKH